jgi:predicted amidohydrolase
MLRVALVQGDTRWQNPAANLAYYGELLGGVEADLAVLPELADIGFTMKKSTALGHDGVAWAKQLAERAGVAVAVGVVTWQGEVRRNTCLIVEPGGREVGRYVKRHPFPVIDEAAHYPPGDRVVTFDFGGFTVAPTICYDLRHPTGWRQAALGGADLFLSLTNWPAARVDHWLTLLKARAIENQAFVVGVNRCGTDPHVTYPGRSVAHAPDGRLLADAGEAENVVVVDLDPAEVTGYRQKFPFLHDG